MEYPYSDKSAIRENTVGICLDKEEVTIIFLFSESEHLSYEMITLTIYLKNKFINSWKIFEYFSNVCDIEHFCDSKLKLQNKSVKKLNFICDGYEYC